MAEYRIYLHDDRGHILSSTPAVCPTDATAIEQAKIVLGAQPGELWQLNRFVATFGPQRTSKPLDRGTSAQPSA